MVGSERPVTISIHIYTRASIHIYTCLYMWNTINQKPQKRWWIETPNLTRFDHLTTIPRLFHDDYDESIIIVIMPGSLYIYTCIVYVYVFMYIHHLENQKNMIIFLFWSEGNKNKKTNKQAETRTAAVPCAKYLWHAQCWALRQRCSLWSWIWKRWHRAWPCQV